jgi:hypothetical protein
MTKKNYERMIQVIDEVFATCQDPDQLQVTGEQMQKLQAIHPATLTELANEEGPLIWVLLIPTSRQITEEFLEGKLTEKQLLEKTKVGDRYSSIYLCSATTLPEQRGKGETKKLCLKAIRSIMRDHPIDTLFVWPFSKEGEFLAESVANSCGLKLRKVPK